MKAKPLALLACVFLILRAPTPQAAQPAADLGHKLQQVLDTAVASTRVPIGVMASVSAPAIDLEWHGAAGKFARDQSAPLKPGTPFRIASVTKVFVAAAIFRLIEDGKLGLYDPISEHIPPETARVLTEGGYDPKQIRVDHLLGHTSGLYDYAMDAGYGAASLSAPGRRWTPIEQITWAMQHGKPVGSPGEKYSYADTGYVILGQIIERVSGQPMAAYIRQALNFQKLQMPATYFETLEPAPGGAPPRAHQYFLDTDITNSDPSMDLYGGGGLVSTTADLTRFFRALIQGRLFHRTTTLGTALTPMVAHDEERRPRPLVTATVAFGVRNCFGHLGYWGTTALYCPDLDLAVVTNVNQSLNDQEHHEADVRRNLLEGIAAIVTGPLEQAARRGSN